MNNISDKFFPPKPVSVLLVMALIYLSNGMFPMMHFPAYVRIALIIGGTLLAAMCLKQNRYNLPYEMVVCTVFLLLLQTITILLNGFNLSLDIFLMLAVLNGLLFTAFLPFESFTEGYRTVIFWISLISVIFFVLEWAWTPFISSLPSFLRASTKWENAYTAFFSFVLQDKKIYTYYRNFGIFTEPGQFQIFINFGFIIELFYQKRPNWIRLGILGLALLTCYSTNGFLSAMLIFLAFFLNKGSFESKRSQRIRIAMIIAVCAVILVLIFGNNTIVNKLWKEIMDKLTGLTVSYDFSDNGTGLERRRSLDVAMDLYLRRPFFGNGYAGRLKYIYNLNENGFIMTFSPLNWFADFGTFYGIIANLGYLAAFAGKPKRILSKLVLVVGIISMISAQNVNADIFTWVLIFYGLRKLLQRWKMSQKRMASVWYENA